MIELTDDNFETEIQDGKVVVDCWATWCGKCKMLKPMFEELSQQKKEYKFCLLNVDTAPKTTEKLNISNIPAIILFENGKEVMRGSFDMIYKL